MKKKDENVLSRMSEHINLHDRALTIIKKKGYELFLYPSNEDSLDIGTYFAKKDGRDFNASNPLSLLGMINIWEEQGDDWWDNPKFQSERISDQLINEVYPDSLDDYHNLDDEQFLTFVKKCKSFFELGMFPNIKITDNITRAELFYIISDMQTK